MLRDSKYLIVLIFILISLCSSQSQYKCKNLEETCLEYKNCVNASAIVLSGTYESCSVKNFVAGLCCKNVTTMVTSASIPIRRLPSQPQPPSYRNSTAITLYNCNKNVRYTYTTEILYPQLPGDEKKEVMKLDCLAVRTFLHRHEDHADWKEYPHMALIGYGDTLQKVEWSCSGSLISEKFILSAAHCGTTSPQGAPRWVKLGDLDINSTMRNAKSAIYSIVKVFDHPLYNSNSIRNDITLFELNTTAVMNAYVRPACLSTSTGPRFGTLGALTGWSLAGAVEKSSNRLLSIDIQMVEDWRCENRFKLYGYNSTTMICAEKTFSYYHTCLDGSGYGGIMQSYHKEPCMWDIFGVTSYGDTICGDENEQSVFVFTKVAYYLDWIQSIVWP